MSTAPHRIRWFVETFQVLDEDRQQRVLEAFRDHAREHVVALGLQRGWNWFVVVESRTELDKVFARSTVRTIDVHSVRVISHRPTSPLIGPTRPAC